MSKLRRKIALAALSFALATLAGCATLPPAAAPELPAPPPVPAASDEYNIFPDPLSGRVEVYRNGEDVGSITGEETEDPPVPRRRPGDDLEQD